MRGKVALVSGASRGLGFEVARLLAREGASVCLASRNREAIAAAADRIEAEVGLRPLATAVDLQDGQRVDEWLAAADHQLGGVDLIFGNIGGPPSGDMLSLTDSDWRSSFELVVLSMIRLVRLAAGYMGRRGGGSILLSSSSCVREPIEALALSNVLRASVAALVKTAANELARDAIRVNQIIPGRFDTGRVRELDEAAAKRLGISLPDRISRSEAGIPLGRYGDPAEFAAPAVFLLSDAASYITGSSLVVDGGKIKGVC